MEFVPWKLLGMHSKIWRSKRHLRFWKSNSGIPSSVLKWTLAYTDVYTVLWLKSGEKTSYEKKSLFPLALTSLTANASWKGFFTKASVTRVTMWNTSLELSGRQAKFYMPVTISQTYWKGRNTFMSSSLSFGNFLGSFLTDPEGVIILSRKSYLFYLILCIFITIIFVRFE